MPKFEITAKNDNKNDGDVIRVIELANKPSRDEASLLLQEAVFGDSVPIVDQHPGGEVSYTIMKSAGYEISVEEVNE
jgi:hypothetical protein